VHWDVEVTNQNAETVAVYTILTLVRQRRGASLPESPAGMEQSMASEAPAAVSPPSRVARTEPDSAPVRVE
jgi:hypothetical protein